MSASSSCWSTEAVATFAVLIHALDAMDALAQGRALQQLDRLGISIRIDLDKVRGDSDAG